MYPEVVATPKDTKSARIVIPRDIREDWDKLLEKKRISQQSAIEGLVRFLLSLKGDVSQSVMLGQLDPSDELIHMVFREIAAQSVGLLKTKKPPGYGGDGDTRK